MGVLPSGVVSGRQLAEERGRVECVPAGEVTQLEPAGEAGGDHDGLRVRCSDGREEALLADEPGHLVVLDLVAERAGHAAAARVGVDDLGPRDASEEVKEWT